MNQLAERAPPKWDLKVVNTEVDVKNQAFENENGLLDSSDAPLEQAYLTYLQNWSPNREKAGNPIGPPRSRRLGPPWNPRLMRRDAQRRLL